MLALYIFSFFIPDAVQHDLEVINENHLNICLTNHAIVINFGL